MAELETVAGTHVGFCSFWDSSRQPELHRSKVGWGEQRLDCPELFRVTEHPSLCELQGRPRSRPQLPRVMREEAG